MVHGNEVGTSLFIAAQHVLVATTFIPFYLLLNGK
jgi:hypothetical protein